MRPTMVVSVSRFAWNRFLISFGVSLIIVCSLSYAFVLSGCAFFHSDCERRLSDLAIPLCFLRADTISIWMEGLIPQHFDISLHFTW